MLAIGIATPITGLTPIPLTVTDGGYSLTIADSQPIIPPNSGGLGVEVEGIAVAQEPGQTVSVEGSEIAAGGSTTYDIDFSFTAPNGGASIVSLTVSDLPDGCYATVTYDNTTGGATVHIHIGPSAVNGTYTYNVQAIISNPNGAVPSGPAQAVQLYDVFPDPNTPATEYPDFSLTFGGTSNPMAQISQQDAGFIFAPALTPPATYGGYVSNQNPWLTYEFLDWPTQEYFSVRLTPIAPLSPGFYRFALSSVQGGETVTLPMVYAVYGGNIQSNPINLQAQITIGPAWPPAQVVTPSGGVTLTTDQYAFTINQGDSIDIEIYETGFTAWKGYGPLIASEQSPENITGNTPQFQNLWFSFPANAKINTYTPDGSNPVLIDTASLVTTLTTPPGVYAFTIYDHNYDPPPSATINVQIMDVGGEQATAPSALLSGTMTNPLSVSRRAQTGLVATSHQGRQVFRALVIPTNRRTPPQTAARSRHMSITNAQALQSDEIIGAWSVAASAFPGHDQIPADVFDGVTAMTTYLPMTAAQFQYLCQSTQLAFNNPVTTLPAPVAAPYALAPGEQIAWYPQAESMRANAVYSAAYGCVGFVLAYTYLPTGSYFGGYESSSQAPNGWIISATSASASSVSSKSGSGFAVLGYYVGWPTPAQILADWIAIYGDLPTKGTIYFSVRPADPFVGVTGMEMTSRCSYENGTLAGADIPTDPSIYSDISTIWVGPKVTSSLPANQPPSVSYEQAGAAIIPPGGANDVQLFFYGIPAFGGNGWTAGAPYAGTLTCEGVIASVNAANWTSGVNQNKQPTPPITVTFNPPTVTIPSGDTTPVATTATFHLPAGTPSGTWLFHLKGTDGKQTLTQKILVESNAGAPSATGLALTPMVSAVPIVSGTDRTINFTISNPNSAPQTLEIFFLANIIYYSGGGPIGSIDFSISPGTNPVTVPAGTTGTPGTVNFTLHIHPTGTITTGKDFNLLVTATNPYITLAALLDFTT